MNSRETTGSAWARWRPSIVLASCSVAWVAAPVAAQQDPPLEPTPCERSVSPLLPQAHWAVRAANRADAWGLTQSYFPAQRRVPLFAVAAALEQAVQATGSVETDKAHVVRGWKSQLAAEYPGAARACWGETDSPGLQMLGARATAGYVDWSNAVFPGTPLHGPTAVEPEQGLVGQAAAAVALGGVAAAAVEPTRGPAGVVTDWQLNLGAKSLMLTAGHGPVGYGFGRGGVVFSGAAGLTHVELSSYRPLRLPGVLRWLGPVHGSAFVGRLYAPQLPGDPYLGGASVGAQPHPRLNLAVHRGAMFGGDSARTPLSALDVVKLASMLYNGEENQVFSFSVRYRLPTEGVLPLLSYAEWGADDSSGALDEAPGYVLGLFAPGLPGIPQVAAGVERSWFGYSPTPDRPVWYWYVNRPIPGPWAAGPNPLGHALGGNGAEWLAFLEGDLLRSRLRWDASLAFRRRDTGNLYAPDRAGNSTVMAADIRYRFARWGEVSVSGYREAADAWDEQRIQLLLSAFGG